MNERRKRKANHQLGFRVQTKQCSTCIYKPSSTLDLKRLEAEGCLLSRILEQTQKQISRRTNSPKIEYGSFY